MTLPAWRNDYLTDYHALEARRAPFLSEAPELEEEV